MGGEGQMRADYHRLRPIEDMLKRPAEGIDVKPELRWQGFNKADYIYTLFAGGEHVRLRFNLFPTSWEFRDGHRICLSIAGGRQPELAHSFHAELPQVFEWLAASQRAHPAVRLAPERLIARLGTE